MIIETSDNRFFRVRDTGQHGLEHVWFGYEVKRERSPLGGVVWRTKATVKEVLVRKEATRVVDV